MTLRARNSMPGSYKFTKELERTSDTRFKCWKFASSNSIRAVLLMTALVAKSEQQKKLHTHAPVTLINWNHDKTKPYCLEPRRLSLDENCAQRKAARRNGRRLSSFFFHGSLHYVTSHSRVTRVSLAFRAHLCAKRRSAWGGDRTHIYQPTLR